MKRGMGVVGDGEVWAQGEIDEQCVNAGGPSRVASGRGEHHCFHIQVTRCDSESESDQIYPPTTWHLSSRTSHAHAICGEMDEEGLPY